MGSTTLFLAPLPWEHAQRLDRVQKRWLEYLLVRGRVWTSRLPGSYLLEIPACGQTGDLRDVVDHNETTRDCGIIKEDFEEFAWLYYLLMAVHLQSRWGCPCRDRRNWKCGGLWTISWCRWFVAIVRPLRPKWKSCFPFPTPQCDLHVYVGRSGKYSISSLTIKLSDKNIICF
jgi:hypothetical protein